MVMMMIKRVCKMIMVFIVTCLFVAIVINTYMYTSTKESIDLDSSFDADCILILGAGVKNNQPTPMLRDRLLKGIELYNDHKAPKIIMSGDHSKEDYNEVGVMKQFAIKQGIPSSDIFMDHTGLSTYESLYRAKKIFQVKKVIIVTQEYHLYRALYIAKSLGLEAIGYSANLQHYPGQIGRDIREIVARCKDFINCIIKPSSTYQGESISIDGNGDITND